MCNGELTYAYIQSGSTTWCLTDDDVIDFKGTVQYNEEDEPQSITFIKDGGDEDLLGNEYSLKTTIICDPSATTITNPTVNVDDPYQPHLTFSHQDGCPKYSVTAWITFLKDHPWVLGSLMIAFGLAVTFFGQMIFKHALAVAAGGIGFLMLMLLFSLFGMLDALSVSNPSGGKIALTVVAFILGIAGGIGIGLLFFKLERLGAAILAGAFGFFVGSTLYNLALFWAYNVYVYFAFSIIIALVFAFLAWRYFENILIFGTAFFGAYVLVRGISMFAGHFPSEIEIISQLSNGVKP